MSLDGRLTDPSCPTPPLYPKPQTPSSLAWYKLREITPGGATEPPPFGRKSVHQVLRAFSLLSFSIVNPPMNLDARALCRQLRVVLHHNSIIHNRPSFLTWDRLLDESRVDNKKKYIYLLDCPNSRNIWGPFGRFKITLQKQATALDHCQFGWLSFVQMDITSLYIWMRPK